MSLLEAPCAKTSWRALLFRAILGITGVLIVCFDIWRFKQVNNSEIGFGGHHCDLFWATRAVSKCACMYEFRKVRIRGARRFYFLGPLLFRDNVQTHLGALLLGGGLLIGTLRYISLCYVNQFQHASNRYHCFLKQEPQLRQRKANIINMYIILNHSVL